MENLDLGEIQGLVRHGYPFFDTAAYRLLAIDDRDAAKRWLAELIASNQIDLADVSGALQLQKGRGIAVAFSASGLKKLGLATDAMRTFLSEFQQGMAAAHRSRLLGDVGASDPANWHWGNDQSVDILLIVFAAAVALPDQVAMIENRKDYPRVVWSMTGRHEDKEWFGFSDGISQPFVEGLERWKDAGRQRPVPAGEFVLGYPNAFGNLPASPSVAANADPKRILPRVVESGRLDLGRNGTFLVLRQLRQDLDAFEAFVGGDEQRAARMVGRWKNGAPLVGYPDKPVPGYTGKENEFGYHREDRHGFACPIGAHIRRANPRDALADAAGISPGAAQALVDQHRIIRRGRVYEGDGEKGLLFLCLNANIERQFEFIQQNWLMNPEFDGLHDETDPLLGNLRPGRPRAMTIQNPRLGQRLTGLGQFVTVKGGEYFFLPGMKALRYLSS